MGDTFYLDKNEFGETYHVAAALIVSTLKGNIASLKINLGLASPEQRKFIELIAANILAEEALVTPIVLDTPQWKVSVEKRRFPDATEIIGDAFRKEAEKSSAAKLAARIKKYFIANVESTNFDRIFEKYKIQKEGEKFLIYVRQVSQERGRGTSDTSRNMHIGCLCQLVQNLIQSNESISVIIAGDINQTDFNKHYQKSAGFKEQSRITVIGKFFEGKNFLDIPGESIAKQVAFYHQLYDAYNLKCIIGMKSGALDGLAFSGIPVIFITDDEIATTHPNRMIKASMEIPYFKPVYCNTSKYEKITDYSKCKFEESVLEAINAHISDIMGESRPQASSSSRIFKPYLKRK